MGKSRILSSLLTVSLLMTLVAAVELDVTLSATSLSFDYGEAESVHLNITNRGGIREKILVDVEGLPTWVNVFPSSIQLSSGGSETVWLKFSSKMPLAKYLYTIKIKTKAEGDWVTQWTSNLLVTVTGDGPIAVAPNHRMILIDNPKESKPNTEISVDITVKSAILPSTLDLLIIDGTKVVQTVSTELTEVTTTVTMDLPKTLSPGIYDLRASLVGKGIVNSTSITILENSQSKTDIISESKFLGSRTYIYVVNDGNVDVVSQYNLELPIYQKLIFNAEPDPETSVVNGLPSMSWAYTVSPGESKLIVTYTKDYTPYALLLLLVGLAIVLVLQKPEPITVVKKIEETVEVDGRTTIKVLIKVVNRSDKSAEDVVIEDTVPGIAVPSKFKIMKPKAKKTKLGIDLSWDLGRMEPYEERLFGYEMILGFGLIGELKLPQPRIHAKL